MVTGNSLSPEVAWSILVDIIAFTLELEDVSAADVVKTARFHDDLRADSLACVEIVLAVEEQFDIKVLDDDIRWLTTVEELYAYVLVKARIS